MSRRFAAGAAVGLAFALCLTGCRGEPQEPADRGGVKLTAAQALAETSRKTGQADSFSADLTVNGSSREGAGRIHTTGRFRIRPSLAFTINIDQISLAGRPLPGAGGQGIFVDNVFYVKAPQMLNGGSWLKVDLDKVQRGDGPNLDAVLGQVQKVNPAEQAKMFTASKDVREVGEETIDGVKTTHYAGSVSLQEALKQFDGASREKLRRVYPQSTDDKISFDLWIDSARLPRKLVSKVQGANGETALVTVIYRDYGKPVTVTAPPADEVQDFDLPRFSGRSPN